MKFLMLLVTLLLAAPAVAQERCPASDMDCNSSNIKQKFMERVGEGGKDLSEADSWSERVEAAGDTADDCIDCAMDMFDSSYQGVSEDYNSDSSGPAEGAER